MAFNRFWSRFKNNSFFLLVSVRSVAAWTICEGLKFLHRCLFEWHKAWQKFNWTDPCIQYTIIVQGMTVKLRPCLSRFRHQLLLETRMSSNRHFARFLALGSFYNFTCYLDDWWTLQSIKNVLSHAWKMAENATCFQTCFQLIHPHFYHAGGSLPYNTWARIKWHDIKWHNCLMNDSGGRIN